MPNIVLVVFACQQQIDSIEEQQYASRGAAEELGNTMKEGMSSVELQMAGKSHPPSPFEEEHLYILVLR